MGIGGVPRVQILGGQVRTVTPYLSGKESFLGWLNVDSLDMSKVSLAI